ncbi:MAG: XRE family transcriptional regulator [Pseudonocardiaceae bacterium]
MAKDNTERQCARCQRASRDKLIAPPEVLDGFWQTEQFREAFTAQHIGRVSRAYRTHPDHYAVYGPDGISQTLLGQWLGLRQPQVSRIETGPPIRLLDTLQYWAERLRIPVELLWFDMPGQTRLIVSGERRDEVVLPVSSEDLPNAMPLPASRISTQRILLPLIVDGRSLLLPLGSDALASSGLGDLLGKLPISNGAPADGLPLPIESLSLDLDFDELHHVAAALSDAHRYLDGSVVDYFRRQLDACEADDGALGPTRALPVVLGILGAIEKRVRDVSPAVRSELLSVGVRAAEFAGWLYRDVHHPRRACFWYDRATEWAQAAGDTAAQGYILLRKSQMAYEDRDAVRVLTLAQAAQYGPWQLPRSVRVEVTQQEARGLAMVGEPISLIEQKLDLARRLLADTALDDAQPGQLGCSFNENALTLRTASCYIEAGKPRQAAALYGQVLSAGGLSRRDRGYFLARRTSSLALAGEPDEAASTGLEAAQIASSTTSQRTKRELIRALAALKPWRNRPGPRALREALAIPQAPVTKPPSTNPPPSG